LLAFKEPCEVEITTDAEYVRQGITHWVTRWKRRHWWKKNHPVRNADLWMELDALVAIHQTHSRRLPRNAFTRRLATT
jgi:ribonuclease HI